MMNVFLLLYLLRVVPADFPAQETWVDRPAMVQQSITSEDEKIKSLIGYVRNLNGAVFIRNGKEYTPEKAADHLQSKWKKHRKKIKTARDFVERLATESKTNEAYQIRYDSGNTIKLRDLLRQELSKLEK